MAPSSLSSHRTFKLAKPPSGQSPSPLWNRRWDIHLEEALEVWREVKVSKGHLGAKERNWPDKYTKDFQVAVRAALMVYAELGMWDSHQGRRNRPPGLWSPLASGEKNLLKRSSPGEFSGCFLMFIFFSLLERLFCLLFAYSIYMSDAMFFFIRISGGPHK